MTQKQIYAGLASLDAEHPFYLALLAVVDGDIESEISGVTIPDLTDSARQFNAGRLAHARDIRSAIVGVVSEAHAANLRVNESVNQ